jgi:hypothetical protein
LFLEEIDDLTPGAGIEEGEDAVRGGLLEVRCKGDMFGCTTTYGEKFLDNLVIMG